MRPEPYLRYLRAVWGGVMTHVVFWLVALIAGALIGVAGFALVIVGWGGFFAYLLEYTQSRPARAIGDRAGEVPGGNRGCRVAVGVD
jgi:hypothetical protein